MKVKLTIFIAVLCCASICLGQAAECIGDGLTWACFKDTKVVEPVDADG